MAFKLYMSKAYGRVEWIILRRVLEQLGIPTHQVDLILRCVSTITFSVLVNGHPSKEFKLQRGIYPYLFILCAKAFSMMLSKVVEKSSLQGIRICHSAPSISHLLFVDDSILFSRAAVEEVGIIRNILHQYELAFGQMVNLNKSELLYT